MVQIVLGERSEQGEKERESENEIEDLTDQLMYVVYTELSVCTQVTDRSLSSDREWWIKS